MTTATDDRTTTPDFVAFIETLLKKTREGKIEWQETADEHAFLASVRGEKTFEIVRDGTVFELTVRAPDGRLLFSIEGLPLPDPFRPEKERYQELRRLYEAAKGVARRVDTDVNATVELLDRL